MTVHTEQRRSAAFAVGEARLPAVSLALSVSKADITAQCLTSPELI